MTSFKYNFFSLFCRCETRSFKLVETRKKRKSEGVLITIFGSKKY